MKTNKNNNRIKIPARTSRIPFSKEERYQWFVEGGNRNPKPHRNKKKYNRTDKRYNYKGGIDGLY